MRENRTTQRTVGLKFVQWEINHTEHKAMKMTLYKAVFGEKVANMIVVVMKVQDGRLKGGTKHGFLDRQMERKAIELTKVKSITNADVRTFLMFFSHSSKWLRKIL